MTQNVWVSGNDFDFDHKMSKVKGQRSKVNDKNHVSPKLFQESVVSRTSTRVVRSQWDHLFGSLSIFVATETHRVNISEVIHLLSRSVLMSCLTTSRTSEVCLGGATETVDGLKTWSHWEMGSCPGPPLYWEGEVDTWFLSLTFDLLRLTNKRCFGGWAVSYLFFSFLV